MIWIKRYRDRLRIRLSPFFFKLISSTSQTVRKVAKTLRPYETEISHRELRQAVPDPTEVKKQQVADFVGAALEAGAAAALVSRVPEGVGAGAPLLGNMQAAPLSPFR